MLQHNCLWKSCFPWWDTHPRLIRKSLRRSGAKIQKSHVRANIPPEGKYGRGPPGLGLATQNVYLSDLMSQWPNKVNWVVKNSGHISAHSTPACYYSNCRRSFHLMNEPCSSEGAKPYSCEGVVLSRSNHIMFDHSANEPCSCIEIVLLYSSCGLVKKPWSWAPTKSGI